MSQAINLSLTCLGNVVAGLCSEKPHIPYRDSKLTRVLKTSFADIRARILVITCLSPTVVCPSAANAAVGGFTVSYHGCIVADFVTQAAFLPRRMPGMSAAQCRSRSKVLLLLRRVSTRPCRLSSLRTA